MARSPERQSTRARVRDYRERLRRQGLRPIQIWVPDTRSAGFAAEAGKTAGMRFTDVIRTWIHVRDIDRNYDALNRVTATAAPGPSRQEIVLPNATGGVQVNVVLRKGCYGNDAARRIRSSTP